MSLHHDTTVAPNRSLTDLLGEFHAALATHPAASALRLMIIPDGLKLEADEILVQRLANDGRRATLVPVKLANLKDSDVPFELSVLDPADGAWVNYAIRARHRDYGSGGEDSFHG